MNSYHHRSIEASLKKHLAREKSIILLGPRQTGKTTLLKNCIQSDFNFNLIIPALRQQFEKRPEDLIDIIEGFYTFNSETRRPLVIIDEIQKVPQLMDVIQYLIDNQRAQFVLTGSSARKLKVRQEKTLNLLPGRLVYLQLPALSILELPAPLKNLDFLLCNGTLPGIYFQDNQDNIEIDLKSYVEVYLEEEVRQEGIVRNLQSFGRFLELAAMHLAEPINFSNISQQLGIQVHQIIEYFQILVDCMIVDRVEALSHHGRRRLTKAPKFLFFDLGVRRLCAREATPFSSRDLGLLFEQFIGIELLKLINLYQPLAQLKYWRDHNGPEVDYIVDIAHQYIPIEVKWTENPQRSDCRHLLKFIAEYPCYPQAYLVCRCPQPPTTDYRGESKRSRSHRRPPAPRQSQPVLGRAKAG